MVKPITCALRFPEGPCLHRPVEVRESALQSDLAHGAAVASEASLGLAQHPAAPGRAPWEGARGEHLEIALGIPVSGDASCTKGHLRDAIWFVGSRAEA